MYFFFFFPEKMYEAIFHRIDMLYGQGKREGRFKGPRRPHARF